MTHSVAWSPYVGSSSYILAGFLLLITCVLVYFGFRFRHAFTTDPVSGERAQAGSSRPGNSSPHQPIGNC